MLLKEFAIRRYGPLPDSGKKELGKFNLFYDHNEEGKTLTIDAILKMLFSAKELCKLEGVKRVAENPDGHLVIEEASVKDASNKQVEQKELKLPESGSIKDLLEISALEFKNIFLIRDSDLTITGESDFYRTVTDRLTGMRSEEIDKIKKELHGLGCITAGGDFLNTTPYKLKDKYNKAQSLLERIEALMAELEAEEFGRFEEELARLNAQKKHVSDLLHQYSLAYNRERYEKLKAALEKLQNASRDINTLKQFNQQEYETWQRAATNLELFEDEQKRLENNIVKQKFDLQQATDRLKKKKHEYKSIEQTKKLSAANIEPALTEYDQKYSSIQGEKALLDNQYFRMAGVTSILIFLISMVGSIRQPSWWLLIFLAGSFVFTLTFSWFYFNFLRKKRALTEIEAKVCTEAEKREIPAEDIHAVRAAAGRLDKAFEVSAESEREAERDLEWQQKEENRLKDEFIERQFRIRDEKNKIDRIRQETSKDTLDHYRIALKRKQDLISEIEKQKSILERDLEKPGDLSSEDAILDYWHDQVKSLKIYAHEAVDLKYDETVVPRLRDQVDSLENTRQELAENLKERTEQLRDLEKDINELLSPANDSYLPCQTTVDLENAYKRIEHWIKVREDKRKCALTALEVFDQLSAEEEQKVTALFGAASPVSKHFSKITSGRYREVIFDSSSTQIKVICADGNELDASQLSGGAYDQLYFSIRMALGEKLLEGGKGFFILDDPFIKADYNRLTILLEMLAEISDSGWQIIYFSAKSEVKEALKEKISCGKVREFSISG